jgi:hypothetical protein
MTNGFLYPCGAESIMRGNFILDQRPRSNGEKCNAMTASGSAFFCHKYSCADEKLRLLLRAVRITFQLSVNFEYSCNRPKDAFMGLEA